MAILMGVKWYLPEVLVSISLLANDVEHIFLCLLAIPPSSLKCLLKSFVHFLIGLLILLFGFKHFLCILDTSPLSYPCFANKFSQSITCLFIFFQVIFWRTKIFNFEEVQFINLFPFLDHALGLWSVSVNFCVPYEIWVQILHLFVCGYPIVSALFVGRKLVLSSFSCLGTFVKNRLTTNYF